MPDNIDSISIELTADTSSAEESLNKLIGRLALLKVAVQGASNFTKIAGGIQRIAEAARKIETDSGEKLSNLAHGLMELSKVGDMSNLGAAAKNLSSVIKAASGSGNSAHLGGLANGIRGVSDALGGIKDADVSKLNAVKDALSGEMSGSLHSSSRSSESAALGGMGSPEPSFGNMAAYGAMTVFKYVADNVRDASNAYREFAGLLGGGRVFTEFADEALQAGERVFTEFADEALQAGEAMRLLPEGVNWTFGDNSQSSTWVADEIRDAANAASDFGDTVHNRMGSVETEFAKVGNAARRSRVEVGSFASAFRGVHSASSHSSGGILHFLSSVARIAKYRFIRQMLKDMGQAFKDLYGWSKLYGTDFADSMDTINTAFVYLRNSIAAMVAPLVNALAPALDFVIDKVVDVLNWFNQLFAALSGADTYTVAKKVAQTWEDSFDSASSSAKNTADEMKRTILGFDEINKLTKPNENSSGGGSGSSPYSNNYQDMFEERPINTNIKKVADGIRGVLGEALTWVKDNLDTILPIAESIGAALLLWKLSGSLLPDMSNLHDILGKIGSLVGGLATAIITIALSYKFSNDYLESGNIGSLIADGLTSILGSAITGLVIAKGFGAQAGVYAAAATLEITAITDMSLSIGNMVNNGITKENVLLGVLGVLKGAAAGFLVTKSISGAIMGASVALAVSFGINAINVLAEDGYSIKFLGLSVGTALAAGVAGSQIAKTFFSDIMSPTDGGLVLGGITLSVLMGITGVSIVQSEGKLSLKAFGSIVTSSGLAAYVGWKIAGLIGISGPMGALVLGGIALTVELIAAIASIVEPDDGIKWGENSLTPEELKEEVQKRFSFDIEATINLTNTVLEQSTLAKTALDFKIAAFSATLDKVKIGVGLDNSDGTLTDLKTQLDEILAAFKEKQGTDKATIELAIALAPPTDESGNPLDATGILNSFNLAQSEIGKGMKLLGDELSAMLAKGIKDGLTDREAQTVAELSTWIMRIGNAQKIGEAAGAFEVKMKSVLLPDLDENSFKNLTDTYFAESERLKNALVEIEEAGYASLKGTRDQLALTIQAYEATGKTVPNTMRTALADLDQQLSDWNVLASVEKKMREETEPFKQELLAALKEVYGGAFEEFQTGFDLAIDFSGIFDPNFDLDSQTVESLAATIGGAFDEGLRYALGGDYTYVMDMADKLELTGWDIIGKDAQEAFYKNLSDKLGEEKAMKVLKTLGFNMSDKIQEGIGSNPVNVMVSLVQNAWTTVSDWVNELKGNTAVNQSVGLIKNAWTFVSAWVSALMGNTAVNQNVSLTKTWATVSAWVNGLKGNTQVSTDVNVNAKAGTALSLGSDNKLHVNPIHVVTASVKANATGGDGTYLGNDNKIHLNSIPGRVTHVAVNAQGGTATYLGDDQKLHLEKIPGRTAQIVANAIGGDGTYYKDNKIHLNPVPGGKTKISVSAVAAWASTIGGLFAYLGIPVDPSTDITAKAKKGWTGTYKSAVGAGDTTSSITASMAKAWGTQKPLDYLGLSGLSTTIGVGLKPDDSKITIRSENGTVTLESAAKTVLRKDVRTAPGNADGGIFSNGTWRDIPQYASGTTNAHGSLFLAGEAGPEIVGHVGGRTEVLNKSQLAAAMYSAVHSAMTGVTLDADFSGYGAGHADDGEHETMYQMMYEAFTAALARGEAMDREKVDLLRQINAKDTTVEVTAASMNRAQTRMNRRAGTTIVPVGT